MYKQFYTEKKTYTKYDNEHYILYLNEVEAQREEDGATISGYEYSGDFGDGGTMIKATEATYDQFVSGLIRTRYSADQVEAILLNIQSDNVERMAEFQRELDTLDAFREECKGIANSLIG